MNYLVVPDNLKPKELLVYAWLYSNANHTTTEYKGLLKNEVYASSRLISLDTEMSQQHTSRTLTLLEDSGYITCLFKSKKPNQRSKYFLDFNLNYKVGDVSVNVSEHVSVNESVDVSVQSVDLTESEAELRSVDVSVNESVDVSVDASSSLNSHLMSLNNHIKNICVFDHWQSKNIHVHRELSDLIKKQIEKLTKKQAEEVMLAIDNYATAYHDAIYYYSNKWTLDTFIKQSNGYSQWTEEGKLWLNYLKDTNTKQQPTLKGLESGTANPSKRVEEWK